MEEITSMQIWEDDNEPFIEGGFKDLLIKIQKNNKTGVEGEEYKMVTVEAFKLSDVSVPLYRSWKEDEKVDLVEVDSEWANYNLLNLTEKRQEIEDWIESENV